MQRKNKPVSPIGQVQEIEGHGETDGNVFAVR